MTQLDTACVILAAGKGTRMKSSLPKVLHEIAGRSMLGHVLAVADAAGLARKTVVVGPDMEAVADEARGLDPACAIAIQSDQNGTADAVASAKAALAGFAGPVVVLYGDTPLLRKSTLSALLGNAIDRKGIAVLGFEAGDPTGYGRLITGGGTDVLAIREHAEASDAEQQIRLCNSGVLAFASADLMWTLIDKVDNRNSKQEFYLTDVIEIGSAEGITSGFVVCEESEVLGVNSRSQLAEAEAVLQGRLRHAAMDGGATLVAPETVFLAADTRLGKDVVVEPFVVFGNNVTVADGATVRAHSHLEGVTLAEDAVVGPYARLRPGAHVGRGAKIGNFVEVKNARIEDGAKVNHLSYVGDARVGRNANVGAGTITCNYDGTRKHFTDIGEGAFIGSNSALVAPVKIGDGAYVGSGSVITLDVESDALAVARGRQISRAGWASAYRARMESGKKKD